MNNIIYSLVLVLLISISCTIQDNCGEAIKIILVDGGPESSKGSYYGRPSTCLGLEIINNQDKELKIDLDNLIYFKDDSCSKKYLRKYFASNSEIFVAPNSVDTFCLFLEDQFDLSGDEFYDLLCFEKFYRQKDNVELEICRK